MFAVLANFTTTARKAPQVLLPSLTLPLIIPKVGIREELYLLAWSSRCKRRSEHQPGDPALCQDLH
jgi:hypothetical protein